MNLNMPSFKIKEVKTKIRDALALNDYKTAEKLQKKMLKMLAYEPPSAKRKSEPKPIITGKAKKKTFTAF